MNALDRRTFEPPPYAIDFIRSEPPRRYPEFQRELGVIAGKTPTAPAFDPEGRYDRLRLTWGAEAELRYCGKTSAKYPTRAKTEWTHWEVFTGRYDKHGQAVFVQLAKDEAEWPAKFARLKDNRFVRGKGYTHKVWGRENWIVEEWVAPADLAAEWDRDRFRYDVNNNLLVDVLGKLPPEGIWAEVLILQTEEGGYEEPSDEALAICRRAWDRERDPLAGIHQSGAQRMDAINRLAAYYHRALKEQEEAEIKASEQRIEQIIADVLRDPASNSGGITAGVRKSRPDPVEHKEAPEKIKHRFLPLPGPPMGSDELQSILARGLVPGH